MSVVTQGVPCFTKLGTNRTIMSFRDKMVGFHVVSHVGWVGGGVGTDGTVPPCPWGLTTDYHAFYTLWINNNKFKNLIKEMNYRMKKILKSET